MKRFKKIILTAGLIALFAVMFTGTSLADATEKGVFKAWGKLISGTQEIPFSTGDQLNDLFQEYGKNAGTIYVELHDDLDMGGAGKAPLQIKTECNVFFNLQGHALSRTLSSGESNGNVVTVEAEGGSITIYSDNGDSFQEAGSHPTSTPGKISGGYNHADGGGIYLDDFDAAYFSNVSICDNYAEGDGGGVFVNDTGSVFFTDASICNNKARGDVSGGGVYLNRYGNAYFNYVSINENYAGDDGGGVYINYEGNVYFDHTSIDNNKCGDTDTFFRGDGGGICIDDSKAVVYLEKGTSVSGNNAAKTAGGIYLYRGKLVMHAGEICGNTACDGKGGGVYATGGTEMVMNSGKICGNTVYKGGKLAFGNDDAVNIAHGGGIYMDGDALTITGGEISGNVANIGYTYEKWTFVKGGGLYINSGTNLISNTVISNNSTHAEDEGTYLTEQGGGIYFYGGTLTLNSVTLSGNRSAVGGGMYICANNDNDVSIIDSTLTGNRAEHSTKGKGGGIYANSIISINNTDISDNYARTDGGGIYADDDLNIANTGITDNYAKATGGGIYANDNVNATNCTISGNIAAKAGGVYMDSEYDFHAKGFCRILQNYTHAYANSNLYLQDATFTSAYLYINALSDYANTRIFVTTEREDLKIWKNGTGDFPSGFTTDTLKNTVFYDDCTYEIKADSSKIYAEKKSNTGKTDPVVSADPQPKTIAYRKGTPQALADAGSASGGVILYAIGESATEAPSKAAISGSNGTEYNYSHKVPTATDIGTYYVWYYVHGDTLHNDSEPQVITATIYEETVYITDAEITNGKAQFCVANKTGKTTALAIVAYYSGERLVNLDCREITLSEGYSEDVYEGEFDHCRAFLIDTGESKYEPLAENIELRN